MIYTPAITKKVATDTIYGATSRDIASNYGLTKHQVCNIRAKAGISARVPTAPIMWFLWQTYKCPCPTYIGGPAERFAIWAGKVVLDLGASEASRRRVCDWFSGRVTWASRRVIWNLLEEIGQQDAYWDLYG